MASTSAIPKIDQLCALIERGKANSPLIKAALAFHSERLSDGSNIAHINWLDMFQAIQVRRAVKPGQMAPAVIARLFVDHLLKMDEDKLRKLLTQEEDVCAVSPLRSAGNMYESSILAALARIPTGTRQIRRLRDAVDAAIPDHIRHRVDRAVMRYGCPEDIKRCVAQVHPDALDVGGQNPDSESRRIMADTVYHQLITAMTSLERFSRDEHQNLLRRLVALTGWTHFPGLWPVANVSLIGVFCATYKRVGSSGRAIPAVKAVLREQGTESFEVWDRLLIFGQLRFESARDERRFIKTAFPTGVPPELFAPCPRAVLLQLLSRNWLMSAGTVDLLVHLLWARPEGKSRHGTLHSLFVAFGLELRDFEPQVRAIREETFRSLLDMQRNGKMRCALRPATAEVIFRGSSRPFRKELASEPVFVRELCLSDLLPVFGGYYATAVHVHFPVGVFRPWHDRSTAARTLHHLRVMQKVLLPLIKERARVYRANAKIRTEYNCSPLFVSMPYIGPEAQDAMIRATVSSRGGLGPPPHHLTPEYMALAINDGGYYLTFKPDGINHRAQIDGVQVEAEVLEIHGVRVLLYFEAYFGEGDDLHNAEAADRWRKLHFMIAHRNGVGHDFALGDPPEPWCDAVGEMFDRLRALQAWVERALRLGAVPGVTTLEACKPYCPASSLETSALLELLSAPPSQEATFFPNDGWVLTPGDPMPTRLLERASPPFKVKPLEQMTADLRVQGAPPAAPVWRHVWDPEVDGWVPHEARPEPGKQPNAPATVEWLAEQHRHPWLPRDLAPFMCGPWHDFARRCVDGPARSPHQHRKLVGLSQMAEAYVTSGSRILDLGAGVGSLCQLLEGLPVEYLGVELDPRAVAAANSTELRRARHTEQSGSCRLVWGDASTLRNPVTGVSVVPVGPWTGHGAEGAAEGLYDLVFTIQSLHHLDLGALLPTINRVTRPGATWVITSTDFDMLAAHFEEGLLRVGRAGFIRQIDPDDPQRVRTRYDWMREAMEERLLSQREICAALEGHGWVWDHSRIGGLSEAMWASWNECVVTTVWVRKE